MDAFSTNTKKNPNNSASGNPFVCVIYRICGNKAQSELHFVVSI